MACSSEDLLVIPFLRRLDHRDLEVLSQAARRIDLDGQRTVVSEGDEVSGIYAVIAGLGLSVRHLADGRRFIGSLLFSGDAFGVATFHGVYTWGLETATATRLCHLPLPTVQRIPDIDRILLRYADHDLSLAHQRMVLLGRKNARERVASFLLSIRDRQLGRGGDASRLWLPLGRSELADFLGLSMETVSRIMSGLARDGLVANEQKYVVLKDLNEVRRLSGSD